MNLKAGDKVKVYKRRIMHHTQLETDYLYDATVVFIHPSLEKYPYMDGTLTVQQDAGPLRLLHESQVIVK